MIPVRHRQSGQPRLHPPAILCIKLGCLAGVTVADLRESSPHDVGDLYEGYRAIEGPVLLVRMSLSSGSPDRSLLDIVRLVDTQRVNPHAPRLIAEPQGSESGC